MRTQQGANADMQRIVRSGEQVLAQCSCTPADEMGRLLAASYPSNTSFQFITNARWILMSANDDGVLSVPWNSVDKVTLGRKRFKHTLAMSFTREGSSGGTSYPAEYVSSAVVKTVEQIRSGAIPVYDLPLEKTTAVKYFSPHDDSPISLYARKMGLPEYALKCSVCGQMAGTCKQDGDRLFNTCVGCERTLTSIENG